MVSQFGVKKRNTVTTAAGTRIIMRVAGRSGSMCQWCARQSINSNIIIDGYMAVHLPVRWYVHMAEQYVNGRSPSSFQYHSVKAEDGKEDIIRQKSWQKRLADLWTFR